MKYITQFACFGVVASLIASSPVSSQEVKIGVVNTFSGPQGFVGEYVDKGMRLYLKQHESQLPNGIKIEIVNRDDGGPNPDKAKQLARELVVRDKVQLLVGAAFTPVALAIAPIAEEAKIPFLITNAGASIIPTKSNYIVRFSYATGQAEVPFGKWASKRFKSVYTLVSDYAAGHDIEKAFLDAYKAEGGVVTGTVRVPLQNPDFAPYMQRIKDAKPEAVFVFVPGGSAAASMMKAFVDLGLRDAGIKLISTGGIMLDNDLVKMGDEALGVITAQHYSAAATRPENVSFVDAWQKEYGNDSTPNFLAVHGYDTMAAVFYLVKQQNGKIDGDKTIELLKGYSNSLSPRGPISIDPATRDIVQNEYLREVRRVNGRLVNVEIETFSEPTKGPAK